MLLALIVITEAECVHASKLQKEKITGLIIKITNHF